MSVSEICKKGLRHSTLAYYYNYETPLQISGFIGQHILLCDNSYVVCIYILDIIQYIYQILSREGVLVHLSMRRSYTGFRSRPVLGRLRLREFFFRSRLRLLLKENIILDFFKTDYKLSKLRSNTCTSTCRSYFLFTLEKTSNDVKFHVIFVNY